MGQIVTEKSYPWWHPRGSSVWVGVAAVGAGLLFATNARLYDDETARTPQNLVELVQQEQKKLDVAEKAVSALRQEVETVSAHAGATTSVQPVTGAAFDYLDQPVQGPGVEVRLWDAPQAIAETGTWDPNQLVVHQQDVESVVNALWSGGAEAMTIQGQRVAATTAVRCVGNVLLVNDQTYSPPYVIVAIGNPDRLRQALRTNPEVQVYQQYVQAAGLGWSLVAKPTVSMPAYTGRVEAKYAYSLDDGIHERASTR